MKKIDIAKILVFFLGIELIILSWIRSYPLHLDSINDFFPNHIYPSYWLGLGLSNVSLFLFLKNSRNKIIRAFGSYVFVMLLYSIYFFYPLLPGTDSSYFRGLSESFINSNIINPKIHPYFQWPSFFILAKFLFLTTDLAINDLSIFVFITTGFILSISLFIFFSKFDEENAYLMTMLYFVGIYHFLNYQFAPQSLALGIFFILLDSFEREGMSIKFQILLLFFVLVLFHAFIPVMFIIYVFFTILFSKTKLFAKYQQSDNILRFNKQKNATITVLVLLTSIFVSVFIYFTFIHFERASIAIRNSLLFFHLESEYSRLIFSSLTKSVNIFDEITQNFSKTIILSLWLILSIGFFVRLIRKNLSSQIIILAVTGFFYLFFGFIVSIFGTRAIQIVFVPSLFGIGWFLEKYRKATYIYLILILLLFPFIRIHIDYNFEFFYQSESGDRATNFYIKECYMNDSLNFFLMSNPNATFFVGRTEESWKQRFYYISRAPNDLKRDLSKSEIPFTFIIYNFELNKEIERTNLNNINELLEKWNNKMDRIYTDGQSIIFINV